MSSANQHTSILVAPTAKTSRGQWLNGRGQWLITPLKSTRKGRSSQQPTGHATRARMGECEQKRMAVAFRTDVGIKTNQAWGPPRRQALAQTWPGMPTGCSLGHDSTHSPRCTRSLRCKRVGGGRKAGAHAYTISGTAIPQLAQQFRIWHSRFASVTVTRKR